MTSSMKRALIVLLRSANRRPSIFGLRPRTWPTLRDSRDRHADCVLLLVFRKVMIEADEEKHPPCPP